MKRIKSAPANLASMTNNKKKTSISLLTKNNEIAIPMQNKFKPEYNFKKIKELKNTISFNSNLVNDIVNDSNNLSIEESTIIFTIINFLANNILKREKLEEAYNYFLQAMIRYFIMLFIHSQILHEKVNLLFLASNCIDNLSEYIVQIK